MKPVLPDKWIDAGSAERIESIAVRTLRSRLDAVLHLLRRVAEDGSSDDNIEDIHELRVWTRRASAALDLYASCLPRRRTEWLRKWLRRIRRTAGEVRDGDVLIQRVKMMPVCPETRHWLDELSEARVVAHQAAIALSTQLRSDKRFARRIDTLLQRVRLRRRHRQNRERSAKRFSRWAGEKLTAIAEQFFLAIPEDKNDAAALHRCRILGKRLRYSMELLAATFPNELRTELYPTVEALQDRLGEINDLAGLIGRLEQKREAADVSAESTLWPQLQHAAQTQLQQTRRAFEEWLTPAMLKELRARFDATLAFRAE